jgi:hypothetical protein
MYGNGVYQDFARIMGHMKLHFTMKTDFGHSR